jgi:hypothetical protein
MDAGWAWQIEHEHHKTNLLQIRTLTADLVPPPDACTTWRALYLALQQFEQDLMDTFKPQHFVLGSEWERYFCVVLTPQPRLAEVD